MLQKKNPFHWRAGGGVGGPGHRPPNPSVPVNPWGGAFDPLPLRPPIRTHVITAATSRTIKCLAAVLTGKWVVTVRWAGPFVGPAVRAPLGSTSSGFGVDFEKHN